MLQDSFQTAVYFNGCQVQFQTAGDTLACRQIHCPLIHHYTEYMFKFNFEFEAGLWPRLSRLADMAASRSSISIVGALEHSQAGVQANLWSSAPLELIVHQL